MGIVIFDNKHTSTTMFSYSYFPDLKAKFLELAIRWLTDRIKVEEKAAAEEKAVADSKPKEKKSKPKRQKIAEPKAASGDMAEDSEEEEPEDEAVESDAKGKRKRKAAEPKEAKPAGEEDGKEAPKSGKAEASEDAKPAAQAKEDGEEKKKDEVTVEDDDEDADEDAGGDANEDEDEEDEKFNPAAAKALIATLKSWQRPTSGGRNQRSLDVNTMMIAMLTGGRIGGGISNAFDLPFQQEKIGDLSVALCQFDLAGLHHLMVAADSGHVWSTGHCADIVRLITNVEPFAKKSWDEREMEIFEEFKTMFTAAVKNNGWVTTN